MKISFYFEYIREDEAYQLIRVNPGMQGNWLFLPYSHSDTNHLQVSITPLSQSEVKEGIESSIEPYHLQLRNRLADLAVKDEFSALHCQLARTSG